MGQRLELLPAVEMLPRLPSVLQRHFPGTLEGSRRRDAHERALERPAGERRADDLVLARGQE
jgi:hypothetical protein